MTLAKSLDRAVLVEEVMGTVASMDIRDPVADRDRQAAAGAAMASLHQIDEQFSAYRPTSEVSRYANGLLAEVDLSHDLREVLRICSVLADDSDGVFRRQRPGSLALDVAGLVKGWAIDRAGEKLRQHGMHQWCLTVGGDVLGSGGSGLGSGLASRGSGQTSSESGLGSGRSGPTSGGPGLASRGSGPTSIGSGLASRGSRLGSGGSESRSGRVAEEYEPWRVAVRDPFDSKTVRAVLPVINAAVATSGSYERGAHVWDGRSGRKVMTPGSFTVVGPFMTYADAYATIGYVMGADGLAWVARHRGYEALRVAPDGSLSTTEGIHLPVNN